MLEYQTLLLSSSYDICPTCLGIAHRIHKCKSTCIDIRMFNVKYLAMHKMQLNAGALSKLLYGFASVRK